LLERISVDRPSSVVLPRSAAAGSTLVDGLHSTKTRVESAVLYDTKPVSHEPTSLTALRAGGIDAVIVRSGSAARALAARVPLWPGGTRIVAGGEPTATVLASLGMPVDAVAQQPDPETVVATTLGILGIGASHD
jgi:uroporphyrinogen-III synthase